MHIDIQSVPPFARTAVISVAFDEFDGQNPQPWSLYIPEIEEHHMIDSGTTSLTVELPEHGVYTFAIACNNSTARLKYSTGTTPATGFVGPQPFTPILDNFNRADQGPPPGKKWAYDKYDANATGLVVKDDCLTAPGSTGSWGSNVWDECFTPDPAYGTELYFTIVKRYVIWAWICIPDVDGEPDPTAGHGYRIQFTSTYTNVADPQASGNILSLPPFEDDDTFGIRVHSGWITVFRKPADGVWGILGEAQDNTYESGYLALEMNVGSVINNFGGGSIGGNTEPPVVPPGTITSITPNTASESADFTVEVYGVGLDVLGAECWAKINGPGWGPAWSAEACVIHDNTHYTAHFTANSGAGGSAVACEFFLSGDTYTDSNHLPFTWTLDESSGILDDFNRADSGPGLGGNWLDGGNQTPKGFKVAGNHAVNPLINTTGTNWAAGVWNEDFTAPCEVAIEISTATIEAFSELHLFACLLGGTNDGEPGGYDKSYQVVWRASQGIELWNIPDYSLYEGPVPLTLAAGDVLKLSVADGGVITVLHMPAGGEWAMVVEGVHSAPYTNGRIAVQVNDGAFELDNFDGGSI